APLLAFVPLAALAAVLVVVAWNMADVPRFLHLMSAPVGDRVVLILTFALTVLVDLTVAIEVGVVLAAFLFMHRMAEVAAVRLGATGLLDDEQTDAAPAPESPDQRIELPPGVQVFQLRGPLFFGVTHRLAEVLARTDAPPRVFIIRMRLVPLIDSSGVGALMDLVNRYARHGATVILSGVQPQPADVLAAMGVRDGQGSGVGGVRFARDFAQAVVWARELTNAAD
ncbi:MAG: STAS domain-containing protein, partial [Rhodospirillaceae bacterium]|nr:STAS domain-containing protein [Rhodospirillaceae bacterium]